MLNFHHSFAAFFVAPSSTAVSIYLRPYFYVLWSSLGQTCRDLGLGGRPDFSVAVDARLSVPRMGRQTRATGGGMVTRRPLSVYQWCRVYLFALRRRSVEGTAYQSVYANNGLCPIGLISRLSTLRDRHWASLRLSSPSLVWFRLICVMLRALSLLNRRLCSSSDGVSDGYRMPRLRTTMRRSLFVFSRSPRIRIGRSLCYSCLFFGVRPKSTTIVHGRLTLPSSSVPL